MEEVPVGLVVGIDTAGNISFVAVIFLAALTVFLDSLKNDGLRSTFGWQFGKSLALSCLGELFGTVLHHLVSLLIKISFDGGDESSEPEQFGHNLPPVQSYNRLGHGDHVVQNYNSNASNDHDLERLQPTEEFVIDEGSYSLAALENLELNVLWQHLKQVFANRMQNIRLVFYELKHLY